MLAMPVSAAALYTDLLLTAINATGIALTAGDTLASRFAGGKVTAEGRLVILGE